MKALCIIEIILIYQNWDRQKMMIFFFFFVSDKEKADKDTCSWTPWHSQQNVLLQIQGHKLKF